MEASSTSREYVTHLMLQGRRLAVVDAASPGVWGCSCILEWSALLISDVNLFPRSSQGSILLPQICSSVDLPVCLAVASHVAPGLFPPPLPPSSTWLTFSPCSHFCKKKKRKRKQNRRSGDRIREQTHRHINTHAHMHWLIIEPCRKYRGSYS